ncbi:MAG: chemoreceptor glutamine deamidase CheD, partial [Gammaproteobacteria bacterium]|nr:chemoreceptor glutamine deamidase CheD [Gammaproteobacteria bacterium]
SSYTNKNAHVVDDSSTARYGNVAMERLINEIVKLGGDRNNMHAKIFGGGRITNTATDIGAKNISFVKEYLEFENIKVISDDVGGEFPRKVYYIPSTDDVYVKKIRRMHSDTIVTRENNYIATIDETEKAGEITFL